MPLRPPLRLLALALAFVSVLSAAPTAEPVALLRGALPNGLRYAVLPRPGEPGRISLRLIVHAGSLDEHADELGYAHFVEHMAFNGTRHYPPGKLVPFFQRLGLAWGADANASTSFTATVYKLDLPAGHAAHLDEALRVLADFADGLTFDAAEVRRERGVVASELRARDDDGWYRWIQTLAVGYAGTGLPECLPPGTPASIEHADAAGLRRFYERCYTPARLTLLVVGDVSAVTLPELIAHDFGALRPAPGAVAPVPITAPAAAPLAATVHTSSVASAAKVTLFAVAPVADDSPATIAATFSQAAVLAVLNQRLDTRRAADPRLGAAAAFIVPGVDDRFLHYGLEADTKADDWPVAVALLETELRRARTAGFTAAELAETTASILAGLESNVASFPGQTADRLANDIAAILIAGRDWHPPAELLDVARRYFATFTPAEAAARLRAALPDDHLRLTLLRREAPAGGPATVLATWQASAAQPLGEIAPAVAAADLVFRYEDFGAPGAIAARAAHADLGVETVRFANGVRLNLRPSVFEPGRFRLWARVGRGTADVPRDRPGINLFAAALLSRCDLGRHDRPELRRLFNVHAVEGEWSFENNDFVIQLTGPAAQLPFALKILTAQLADPKLEPAKLADAVAVYPGLIGALLQSAGGATKPETLFRAAGDDPRFKLADQAELQRYDYTTVTAWLQTRWLAGPLEIGLAGDFDATAALTSAAASVGTLPPRADPPALPAERIAFRPQPYRNLHLVDLPDHAATVRLFWPAADIADPVAAHTYAFAAAALQEDLRVKLREELGVTYSPDGAVYQDAAQPDFGFLAMTLTFPPDQAIPLAEKALTLSARFAGKGLSKEQFARLREPLRAAARADLQSNEWWLSHLLLRAQTQPALLAAARAHATAFDMISRDAVNRLLATRLRRDAASCVGFIPQAAPAPAPPKS